MTRGQIGCWKTIIKRLVEQLCTEPGNKGRRMDTERKTEYLPPVKVVQQYSHIFVQQIGEQIIQNTEGMTESEIDQKYNIPHNASGFYKGLKYNELGFPAVEYENGVPPEYIIWKMEVISDWSEWTYDSPEGNYWSKSKFDEQATVWGEWTFEQPPNGEKRYFAKTREWYRLRWAD